MVLVKKMSLFPSFFSQYRPGKCVLRYSRTKRLSRLKKKEDQNDEKLRFSQGVKPIVLVKNWLFFNPFLFKQYSSRKSVLQYSRTKKTPLKALRIKSLKYQKIHIFTTAKPMVLVKKGPIFKLFYKAIKPRKLCYTIF